MHVHVAEAGVEARGVIFPIPRGGDKVMRAFEDVAQTVKAEVLP